MLNKFRSIDYTWDKANKTMRENVETMSSDERGRKLVVQVLNNGQVEDVTGVGLNLYWETKDRHHNGLDNFDLIDAKAGIFELYFTTGMLSNIGDLRANLHLINLNAGSEGAITSKPFTIEVRRGINTEAVESEDSFSALTEALNRVVEIETQEQERIDNEKERKSNESTRKTNEIDREEAEVNRESTFAGKLTEWQEGYDDSEDERDSLYLQAEEDRDDQYEVAEGVRDNAFQDFLNNFNVDIESFYNVKDFGAKGDGATKDYNAIQAALDDVYQKGGGYVYIPSGHYIIESRLEIGDNTHLFGAGKSTLLDGVSSSVLPQGVSGLIINKGYDLADDYAGASNFSMRNFAITSSDEERQGIYLEGAADYYISDITSVGTCKDHWFDINNTKHGVFERLWLNKPNSSIFQMDVRKNQTEKGVGNDSLIIRDVFMEDSTDQSNYENNNFRQSGFHFHRGSCKNIYISNVISENVHTLFYKDKGIDVDNLLIENVTVDGVYHTFFFEHGTSEPSDSYKDLIIENFDVTSKSTGRGLGWFGAVQNLKVKNFKLHTNSLLSDRNGFVSFGVKSKNISLENLDLSGEAFDNDKNIPLWDKAYFTETMKEHMFKSLKGTYTYEFKPVVLGINSGYADQQGLLTFNNGDIHLNIRVNHPSITSSSDYLAIKGYPTLYVDENYSRFMGTLGYLANSAAIRKSATVLTPYIRDLDEGLLIRRDYGNYAARSDAAGLLDVNLTIEIQGKSWN